MSATQTAPRAAISVDELKRAWQAVQTGQFRTDTSRRSTAPRKGRPGPTWEPDEDVLPVIGCGGNAGASTVALAIATVADSARVVECCTVTATGLAAAATAELGRVGSGWTRGTRDNVTLERGTDVLLGIDEVPLPPPPISPLHLTVLDIGWELGQVLATPSWVGDRVHRAQVVVVVTSATVPGLRRLEGALALLEGASVVAAVVGPRRKKWARGIDHTMGALTRALERNGQLIDIPEDRDLASHGLDTRSLPAALTTATTHLLRLVQATNHPDGISSC